MKELNKQLNELQKLAITITRDSSISVRYLETAETAYYEQKTNRITLTSQCLPKDIEKYPIAHAKLLDGLLAHESGHALFTNPLEERYQKFEKTKAFRNLAHFVVNAIEDKRINYLIEIRYRHDLGKRLEFLRRLERSAVESTLNKKEFEARSTSERLISILINKGLYEANLKILEETFNTAEKRDLNEILEALERAKYQKVTHDLLTTAEIIYRTLAKYLHSDREDNNLKNLVPKLNEGTLETNLGKIEVELKEGQKEAQKEKQKAKEKQKSLKNGYGCGTDKGDLINAPEPNFSEYASLVNKNASEINMLLNLLKRTVKPIITRSVFQRKGHFMNGILAKAYTNSIRHEVKNIYQNSSVHFEKQKIALQILLDCSGSMSRETALDVCTVLTEVFSQWLEEKSFSLLVFAQDYQKIKTFYELSAQTKARIPNISVDTSNTVAKEALEIIQKMFNGVSEERTKVLVIASDFYIGDINEVQEVLKELEKSNVKIILLGLCSVRMQNFTSLLANSKNVSRTIIENLEDLPKLFLDVYLSVTQTTLN